MRKQIVTHNEDGRELNERVDNAKKVIEQTLIDAEKAHLRLQEAVGLGLKD